MRVVPALLALVALAALAALLLLQGGGAEDDATAPMRDAEASAPEAGAGLGPAAGRVRTHDAAETPAVQVERETDVAAAERAADFLEGRVSCEGPRFDWPPRLTWFPAGGERTSGRAAEDGHFRLRGESAGGGVLRVPGEYRVLRASGAEVAEPDGNQVLLRRIHGPVGLHLELRPAWTGRVLVDGVPAAEVGVSGFVAVGDRSSTRVDGRSGRSDAVGRFRIAKPDEGPPLRLELRLEDASTGRFLERTLSAEKLAASDDLGDFELPPLRSLRLAVRTPAGAPVAGAEARVHPGDERYLTGDDGRVRLERVPATGASLDLSCAGFAPEWFEIDDDERDSIEAVLRPSAALSVRLVPAEGTRAEDHRVALTASRAAFLQLGADDLPLLGYMVPRAARAGASTLGTDRVQLRWQPSADGPVTLTGLAPASTMHLTAHWRGTLVASEIVDPLTETEHREVTLTAVMPVGLLRVRMLAPDGAQLLDGELIQMVETGSGASGSGIPPERDGSWLIADVRNERTSFHFEHDGYLESVFEGLPPATVVMTPSTSLEVELVERDGTAQPEDATVRVIWERAPGGAFPQETAHWNAESGCYLAREALAGLVQVSCVTADGREVGTEWDSRTGPLRLVLPPRE